MFDLDAYCARIGYTGPRKPTLATLRAIHALHPAAIPFENLDPLLGRPVSLEREAVAEKLLRQRRGGYCFEQNALLRAALEAMGFSVTGLSARVVWMAPPERPMGPRTHMLLRVDLDGDAYIADVGFGGFLLDAPLRLVADIEQATPTETLRLVRAGDGFRQQAMIGGEWADTYLFTLDPQYPSDYMLGNWYTSTHPQSLFRNNLLLERRLPEVRISLFNRKLTKRFGNGRVEQRILADATELNDTLVKDFAVTSPVETETVFERLQGS